MLGTLRLAGMSLPMAGHANALLDAFVFGFGQEFRFGLDLILDALERTISADPGDR
jgi:hypothetical protein